MGLISGIFFTFWRILQILTLIPTLGMLAYFVHGFVSTNTLTPDSILVLFITSVLAAVWCIVTLFAYHRTRHSAFFVSLIDLAFVGTFIGAVYALRGIAKADCSNFTSGGIYLNLGPFGYYSRDSGTAWSLNVNKTCAMLKACFAFGIMNCIFFAITSFLALFIHRNKREERDYVRRGTRTVRRHSHRGGSRHSHSHSRSHYGGSSRRPYV
ncbi:MAG: hypothetical protein M1835_003268 [Candelina submexicana]|nr:MAG: hypothetical protein M1835_003268 [Candelina submexicana]